MHPADPQILFAATAITFVQEVITAKFSATYSKHQMEFRPGQKCFSRAI
jgi:hypothetical protein